jgi:hypothetical protein
MQRLIGKFCFIRQCKVFNLGRGKSQKESEPPWTLRAIAFIEASISSGLTGV